MDERSQIRTTMLIRHMTWWKYRFQLWYLCVAMYLDETKGWKISQSTVDFIGNYPNPIDRKSSPRHTWRDENRLAFPMRYWAGLWIRPPIIKIISSDVVLSNKISGTWVAHVSKKPYVLDSRLDLDARYDFCLLYIFSIVFLVGLIRYVWRFGGHMRGAMNVRYESRSCVTWLCKEYYNNSSRTNYAFSQRQDWV